VVALQRSVLLVEHVAPLAWDPPKIPGRNGSVGRPRFSDFAKFTWFWLNRQGFQRAIPLPHTKIVDGKDVHPLKRIHEQHLDGPSTDPFNRANS
jgi:hypothetical protein